MLALGVGALEAEAPKGSVRVTLGVGVVAALPLPERETVLVALALTSSVSELVAVGVASCVTVVEKVGDLLGLSPGAMDVVALGVAAGVPAGLDDALVLKERLAVAPPLGV